MIQETPKSVFCYAFSLNMIYINRVLLTVLMLTPDTVQFIILLKMLIVWNDIKPMTVLIITIAKILFS